MRIYDISLPISNELPCWPDDPAIELTRLSDTAKGDVATVSHLSSTVHIGTHVDAPAHFVPGGAGVDQLDLNVLIGLCHVVHMPDTDVIDSALLDQLSIPAGTTRLLLRTRNS
ncbi:MAG: cyclase family protein, partial [Chloroflexota bacterium]|nr:cyclase family protein [Chloroflexota bacterium]